jgi:hypothetical protein
VFDFWPVGLMLAGGWFIVAGIRRMRAAAPHAGHDGPTP